MILGIGQERRARTRLAWHSPDACAHESAVREAVAKLAGRDVFSQEPYDYVVRGSVESPGGSAWVVHLRLETSDGSLVGERELNRAASSCHSLDVPTAVALALMVDLQAVVAEPKRPLPEVSTPTIVYRLPPAPRLAWSVGGALSGVSAGMASSHPQTGSNVDEHAAASGMGRHVPVADGAHEAFEQNMPESHSPASPPQLPASTPASMYVAMTTSP